ncbi:MAG: MarR family winged helix-turn-helix transcriptional regulator [Bacteroidota bacterium]
MILEEDVSLIMAFYPRVYFACHTRHVNDPVKGVKLTANQGSILDHLDEHEPVTLQELALHLGVTPSTMSISIDRLEKLGYVRREKDKADSRKVKLYLTAQGSKIKQSKSVLDPERVASVLSRLTQEERMDALKGLGLLASASDMEMKSQSFEKAWAQRNKKKS